MNLDFPIDCHSMMFAAMKLGVVHVSMCKPREKSARLMQILAEQHGSFGYRNFHVEILNRAYGLAFTNAMKMKRVRKMQATQTKSPTP